MEPHLFEDATTDSTGASRHHDLEARIAVISYKAKSSLTAALGALQMTTVTLFNAQGKPKQAVNLKTPLILNFDHESTSNTSKCAFYDFSQLKWSSQGCFLDEELGGQSHVIGSREKLLGAEIRLVFCSLFVSTLDALWSASKAITGQ